ncbi:MAG: Ig-like domain-containing protein, partial [Minisyncoccia bacterium]
HMKTTKKLLTLFIFTSLFLFSGNAFTDYTVNFEGPGETNSGYAAATVNLNGLDWTIGSNALIGFQSGDIKNGSQAARIRSNGSIAMTADKTDGIGVISFDYVRSNFSGDRAGTSPVFIVEYSTDGGSTWTQTGPTTDLSGVNSLITFSSTINQTGNVRVRIVQTEGTSGKRWNVDDILMTDYFPAPATPTSAPDLLAAFDTGASDTDNLTSSIPATFNVECTQGGNIITLYLDGSSIGTHICAGTGTESMTSIAPAPAPAGTYDGTFDVTYTESATGNESTASPALSITFDTLAPAAPTIAVPSSNATVSGTAEANSQVQVNTPSGAACTAITNASGNYSCDLAPNPVDGEEVRATATDLAGNTGLSTTELAGISFVVVDNTSSSKSKSTRIVYVCKDASAVNYNKFGRHKASLCEYTTPNVNPEKNIFDGTSCSAELVLTQNMKAPSQNGKYNAYTGAVVTQAHLLQKHMNRLGFNSGAEDGIIGPITKGAIQRMQTYLGTPADGYVGPLTRALINNSCS